MEFYGVWRSQDIRLSCPAVAGVSDTQRLIHPGTGSLLLVHGSPVSEHAYIRSVLFKEGLSVWVG
jgi:hypothetical protein